MCSRAFSKHCFKGDNKALRQRSVLSSPYRESGALSRLRSSPKSIHNHGDSSMTDPSSLKMQALLQSALLASAPESAGLFPSLTLASDGAAIYVSRLPSGLITRAESTDSEGIRRYLRTQVGITGSPLRDSTQNHTIWTSMTFHNAKKDDKTPLLRLVLVIRPGPFLVSVGLKQRADGEIHQSVTLAIDYSAFADKGTLKATALVRGEDLREIDVGEVDVGGSTATPGTIKTQFASFRDALAVDCNPSLTEFERFLPLYESEGFSKGVHSRGAPRAGVS